MSPTTEGHPQSLEKYRECLRVWARLHVDPRLQAKFDASDVVQEALLNAYQGPDQLRGRSESEIKAWLYTILANSLKEALGRFSCAARILSANSHWAQRAMLPRRGWSYSWQPNSPRPAAN